MSAFHNEQPFDLANPGVRRALTVKLDELDARATLEVGSLIGEERIRGASIRSVDPSEPSRLVAVADQTTPSMIDAAVALADEGARAWSAVSAANRTETLRRAADLLQDRRLELVALMVREAAKPWVEADGEVAEAIDFVHLYTEAINRLPAELAPLPTDGHRNSMRLLPRGVTVAIAPWNFPLAIPLGMTVAALAAGNAVILKPAEQTPACGDAVVGVLRDAGVPAQALSLLQGRGTVGAGLVRHPGVATVAFTGSSRVGCEIAVSAARVGPQQRQLKRLVAEMGGKNCAIVAADADVERTTDHLIRSAYSYAGQKCSAVSRILVDRALAEELTDRLSAALGDVVVGPPTDFQTSVPPLIDEEAKRRLDEATRSAEKTGKLVAQLSLPAGDGYYAAPTLVADLPPDSELLRDELFGPLVTIETFDEVGEAIDRVDMLPQALVGGLYTEDEVLAERLVSRSPVGNLYVNRPTVGALVGGQPFGGGRLSGTGHKAGSMHYVAAFCDQQVVCERIGAGD